MDQLVECQPSTAAKNSVLSEKDTPPIKENIHTTSVQVVSVLLLSSATTLLVSKLTQYFSVHDRQQTDILPEWWEKKQRERGSEKISGGQ